MTNAPLYTEYKLEELNRLIALRKLSDELDWTGDLNLSIQLLNELCRPQKGSKRTRALSITIQTRDSLPWYEITNIFTQEDNGDYTLLEGWNDSRDPVIWFEGPELAPLCCLAWLTATESPRKAKKTPKLMGITLYDSLTRTMNAKRIEGVFDSLEAGLTEAGIHLDRATIESIAGEAIGKLFS